MSETTGTFNFTYEKKGGYTRKQLVALVESDINNKLAYNPDTNLYHLTSKEGKDSIYIGITGGTWNGSLYSCGAYMSLYNAESWCTYDGDSEADTIATSGRYTIYTDMPAM